MTARLLSISAFVLLAVTTANSADTKRETLWAAVRSGDVKAIQDAIVAKCSFLPTVSTISAILAMNDPTLQTTDQVSSATCAAIAASKNKRSPPTVSGIVIRGCPVMPRPR